MRILRPLLTGMLMMVICLNASSQKYDRNFSLGLGLEYPLYETKKNPLFSADMYIYIIGISTEWGWIYNDELIREFGLGYHIGNTFNFSVYTKFDFIRIIPGLKGLTIAPGYKFSRHRLVNINDLKARSHILFLRTDYNVTSWFTVYNKLDYVLSTKYLTSSDVVFSFGVNFHLSTSSL
jgi:hypothetical protein